MLIMLISNRRSKGKQIYNILQYIKEKLALFIRRLLKMLISLTSEFFNVIRIGV